MTENIRFFTHLFVPFTIKEMVKVLALGKKRNKFLCFALVYSYLCAKFRTMRYSVILLLCLFTTLVGCKKDDATPPHHYDRTVLVYIAAENNLSPYINYEMEEIAEGSKDLGNNALVIFVDGTYGKSYIMRMENGERQDVCTFDDDNLSSDPKMMRYIINYTKENFPADEYGMVLWGHASGWEVGDSVAASRQMKAYGIDTGNNTQDLVGKWMNMYTLASTLKEWGQPLRFIFADCCQFQCIESAYELRATTDYIIGSPAEIPGVGAPYDLIIKHFFSKDESFYEKIVDHYFAQLSYGYTGRARTPLSVIKTSTLPQLAEATHEALQTFLPMSEGQYPNMNGLIYYRGKLTFPAASTMYDMNDFMLHKTDSATYANWKKAFDDVVIYKKHPAPGDGWMTNELPSGTPVFSYMTDERYGGVSMFVPQNRSGSAYLPYRSYGVQYDGYNAEIKNTSWYWAARLNELGW